MPFHTWAFSWGFGVKNVRCKWCLCENMDRAGSKGASANKSENIQNSYGEIIIFHLTYNKSLNTHVSRWCPIPYLLVVVHSGGH